MKRVFICGDLTFPRGGSSSNYIQYLGMALIECGYEVHVVSTKNKNYTDKEINGIIIDTYEYSKNKMVKYVEYWVGAERKVKSILRQYRIDKDDLIIMYSQKAILGHALRKFAKKREVKIGAAVVELFEKKDITSQKYSWNYFQYKILIDKEYENFDFLFTISTYIESKYRNSGVKQLVLPILADPYEYPFVEKEYAKKRFIFPAMGKMKDALDNMVLAVNETLKEKKDDVEIHFCGVKKEQVARILNADISEIDSRMIFHSWMDYSDLVDLYNQVQFLLIARADSQMTRANFPSKVPEVMTYGVVPLASRVGDYTNLYLKDNYNSFIFEGCDVAKIKEVLCRCIDLSEQKMKLLSDNARKTVEDEFYYKQWVHKISCFLWEL